MRLNREHVVTAAIELLDADGLDALTMRKLASRLGVQAGALYYHFANKTALLNAMADRFLEGGTDDLPDGTWDQQGVILAQRMRQALLAHRDGARVMAGTFVSERNTVLTGNAALEILCSSGLPVKEAGWTVLAIMYYVLGHTIEEQAQRELAAQGSWQVEHTVDGVENRMAAAFSPEDADDRFDYGLKLLIDGIRRQLS